MRNWQQWHLGYEDPTSSLSRRLIVVQRRVRDALDAHPLGSARVLSLCAGDGRDLLPVIAHAQPEIERAVLIEKDPGLAAAARRSAAALGLDRVQVLIADAGKPGRFTEACPVDLLLLCGIFGNVSEPDIRTTVAATPALLRDGGTVIWTRGASAPDLRPSIRRWYAEADMREVAFDQEATGFGVGAAVKPSGDEPRRVIPPRLFHFIR